MGEDVLVRVEGVSKKYCRTLKRSLWYGVQDVANEVLGHEGHHNDLRKNEFWAVKGVSFELNRGECLGLIGPNGAGKSTLLKMLNGLVKPDQGRITMRGRVGALIELGAGFNPILTARENIYINGSVLGFSKREINSKFEAIVDFAEVEEFLDMPVQNFSSGMKVRLGFAVAAQMEPDVLLIDEVLAVGDAGFRVKCFQVIRALSERTAVILVSHQMPEIARACNEAILLANSECVMHSSDVPAVIQKHFELFKTVQPTIVASERGRILAVRVKNESGEETDSIPHLGNLIVEMDVQVHEDITCPAFGVSFANQNFQLVLQSHSRFDGFVAANPGHPMTVRMELAKLPLGPGNYFMSVGIEGDTNSDILARWFEFRTLRIEGDFVGFAPIVVSGNWQILEKPVA